MNKRRIFPILALLIGFFVFILHAEIDAQNEVIKKRIWQVRVKLEVPNLTAVQLSVLDEDPVSRFKERVAEAGPFLKNWLDITDQEEKEKRRNHVMEINWDDGFKYVTGDEVWLATKDDPFRLNSSHPGGKKWVVTKTANIDENPVCWAIPVEVEKGEKVEVILTKDNMFPLASIFDEVIAEISEEEPLEPKGEPEAYALYEQMIEAMRNAKTMYYESEYEWGREGEELRINTYKIWMKKPNYTRLEVKRDGELKAVIVGDGKYFWTYWPNKRPHWSWEDSTEHAKTCSTSYMVERSLKGFNSIAHLTSKLDVGMSMTIIEPSVFHGSPDALIEYMDGVFSVGSEKVNGEECDVIEVSYMDHQRSKYYWLSKKDHLPRKLKQVVRVEYDLVVYELWSDVVTDIEISDEKFTWQAPDHWTEWQPPHMEEGLLKAGTDAPEFEFQTIDGSMLKLSDLRGKIVLINFWRVGCPPCREEIPHLEKLYNEYKDKGLVVIGFNSSDDLDITLELLEEHSVTYPNIVNVSEDARKIQHKQYNTLRGQAAVPLNYLIDRDGKVVDAWYGFNDGESILKALLKVGIE